jgi:ferredoxin
MSAALRIDAAACDGVGRCAQIAGRVVTLDRWGYPIIVELSARDVAAAHRAAMACTRKALWVEDLDEHVLDTGAGGRP